MQFEGGVEAEQSPLRLAIFDLDGTTIVGDSLLEFVELAVRRFPRTLRRLPVVAAGLLRSLGEPRRAKEAVLAVIDPLRRDEQAALIDAFVERVVASRVRPEIVRLRAEQEVYGRLTVLLSASPDMYVAPLAARLGFAAVVATRLVRRSDGGWSSRIEGENVRGVAKLVALEALCGARPIDWGASFACGDRSSDRALLDRVGEAVVVHPDTALRTHARAHGWRIVP